MRTFTDPSTMTINYPDDRVFSGDLNRVEVIKNTTATFVEVSFTISGYLYQENLYFLTSSVVFSMSDIFKLLYDRKQNETFSTAKSLNITFKLYNNTTLIDTKILSITDIILGKRRVFDEMGKANEFTSFDYCPKLGLTEFGYLFYRSSFVTVMLKDTSTVYLGLKQKSAIIDLSAITDPIDYIYYSIRNYVSNQNLQYLGGNNFWTSSTFAGCSTTFGITVSNKLQFIIPDVSCGNSLEIEYTKETFEVGKSYKISVTIDTVNNPSGNEYGVFVNLGGNESVLIDAIGTTTVDIVCGSTGVLKLIGYMDADTGGFGSHSFSATTFVMTDTTPYRIYLNEVCPCDDTTRAIGLRFLNRFGIWRYYAMNFKSENIASGKGTSLLFIDENLTEFSGLYSEQQKGYSQSINVYIESVEKSILNDLSDILYSDYKCVYDEVNSVWVPVKINTNSFNIVEKENLFDVSLNILLQSNNE